ncbi:MAG TPA: hypothetical protein EYG04_00580, partial [Candidatus Poseidoniales archaeon]|nr:hypothetical protein [Candidatus Poseidoniales archaeon]
DKNKDGRLDELEITDVVGDTAIAQKRIIAADTDRDGTISLPEYLAQPDDIIKESSIEAKSAVSTSPSDVAEPTSAPSTTQFSLPKPVAPVPVRKPIENLNTLSQGQSAGKGNQYSHVQQGAPSHPAVEPVIRSGIHCRGCKIGLDPHWRHCPICGSSQA